MAENEVVLTIKGKDEASAAIEGIQGKLGSLSGSMKKMGIAMTAAGAAIVASMGLMLKSYVTAGDEIQKMALRTGFSTEALSELKYAADLSGTSLASVGTAIKYVGNLMSDIAKGVSTASDNLRILHLRASDLRGLSPEETFMKLAEAVAGIQDPLLRAGAAQDIFGRSGTELLPMLADGAAGLDRMREEARKLGVVFTAEAANKAAEFADALTKLKGGMESIKMTIASTLIPALMPLVELMSKIFAGVKAWTDEHPALIRWLVVLAGALGIILTVLGTLTLAFGILIPMLPAIAAGFAALWAAILGPIGWVIAAITALIAVGALIAVHWDTIKTAAIKAWTAIKDAIVASINWIIERVNDFIDVLNKIPFVNIGHIGLVGGGAAPAIPSFAGGGVVPGTLGSPRLIVAHGGERIGLEGAAGGGLTVVVQGSVVTQQELANVVREWFYKLQKGNYTLGLT